MANDSTENDESPELRDIYDRERGIFTPRDRKFLAGVLDDELSENSRRQKRYRLRQRMVHALQDLAYLSVMDTEDTTQLIHKLRDEGLVESNPSGKKVYNHQDVMMIYAANMIIEFIYELYEGYSPIEGALEPKVARRKAIEHYEKTGEYAKYDVSIEVSQKETMDTDELAARVDTHMAAVNKGLYGASEILDLPHH